jgi:hypothetical protein
VHTMGETRDDAGNADLNLPLPAETPPSGAVQSDLPDPFPEVKASGGTPSIDDDEYGLGPPSGHDDSK